MERLTIWNEKAQAYSCNSDFNCNDYAIDGCDCPHIEKMMNKLGKYEDLEEQGRLLKLPCKIGDDVYFVPSKVNYRLNVLDNQRENNKVYHQKVEKFVFKKCGWYLELDKDVAYGTGRILTDRSFNETWFLAKSEAEAKLKELRGEEND